MTKSAVQLAKEAVLEAKAKFEADPSEANVATLESKSAEYASAVDLAERASKASNLMGAVLDGDVEAGAGETGASRYGLATKFIESAEYKSFQERLAGAPSNSEKSIALGSVKLGSYGDVVEQKAALQTPLAHLPAQRFPMIDPTVRPELTLMDLISKGRIDSNSLQYVQVVSITRNAALQPENTGTDPSATPGPGVVPDTLKPISEMTTKLETANVFGYADGYEVTTQLLSDASAFATFMDGELRYSIRNVQENYLLNGSGTNGEPRGILNTTGLQGLTYDGSGSQPIRNLVEKVRTGIRKVQEADGQTTAILLHPEDNEAIDLMKDANGNYIFGGPGSVGAQTLWGRPRVVSEKIDKGTVLMGDFRQVAYLDRDGISIEAFNQHKDFAQRNLVYVRAEARGLQVIWRPARLLLLEEA